MSRATIAVDVDDTVASLMPEWLRIYNERYNRGVEREHITDWECSCIPQEHRGEFYGILNSQTLYDNVQPIDGALAGCNQLRRDGYRLVFVTSAMPGHAGAKLRWLRRQGFLEENGYSEPNYIECYDKSLIRASLLIDDKPATALAYPAPVIMYATPANKSWMLPEDQHHKEVYRIGSWKHIPILVNQILEGRLR